MIGTALWTFAIVSLMGAIFNWYFVISSIRKENSFIQVVENQRRVIAGENPRVVDPNNPAAYQ